MIDEIELMKASHEFEISRIKAQLLSDVTIKIMEKYDYITFGNIDEIVSKARLLAFSVFGGQCKEKGGEQ